MYSMISFLFTYLFIHLALYMNREVTMRFHQYSFGGGGIFDNFYFSYILFPILLGFFFQQ